MVRTHLPGQELQETRVRSPGQEDPLEEGRAAHSSVLAWRFPWTEEPGGLQPMGLQRVGHEEDQRIILNVVCLKKITSSLKLPCTKMSILQRRNDKIFAIIHPFQQITLAHSGV